MSGDHKKSLSVLFGVLVFVIVLAMSQGPIQAVPVFQSVVAEPPEDPYFITSASGGTIFCDGPQGAVWVAIPDGYTSAGGAHFRCDFTSGALSQWPGGQGAWDDRGYLIGFWPSDIPIGKPLNLVFDIDPARMATSFQGRYYAPSRGWVALGTTYRETEGRVYVTIPEYLTASGYPGNDDRFLVALFAQAPVVPSSTATSKPTVQPSSTPTSVPDSPTLTVGPPTSSPTTVPTDSASASKLTPVASAATPVHQVVSEDTPTDEDLTPESGSAGPNSVMLLTTIVVVLAVIVLVLGGLVAVLVLRR